MSVVSHLLRKERTKDGAPAIEIMDGVRSAPTGRITAFWTPSPDCVRCGGLHPGLFSIPPYGRKGQFRPVDASSQIKRANEVRSCDCPGMSGQLRDARVRNGVL